MAYQNYPFQMTPSNWHELHQVIAKLRRWLSDIEDRLGETTATVGAAPNNAQYVTAATSAGLSAERVATDTTSVTWDFGTSGQAKAKRAALSGDASASADSNTLTLATVNSNVGTFGSATQASQVTVNAKGLVTAAANVTVTPAASSITGGAALTKGDDTNVTLTLGGSPTSALLAAASITAGWTGQLSVARGGTGLSTIPDASVLVTNDANVLSALTPSAGQSIRVAAGGGSWEAYTPGAGGGTPGGSDTHVQYNDGGAFGGEAAFTYNKTTDTLSATNIAGSLAGCTGLPLSTGVTGDLPFANLTQGSALSVLGVTGNATADNASIAAASDHQVLRRSGTAVAFGTVNLASGNAVTGLLPAANMATSGTVIADFVSENPPYTNYATADVRFVAADGVSTPNTPEFPIKVTDFDASSYEYMMFEFRMRPTYASTGITVYGVGAFSSAITSNARIEMALMRLADGGDDWDAVHTFSWQGVTVAANGTSGKPTYFSIPFTDGSQMDSVAAGESFMLAVRRKYDHGDDLAAGDFELKGCLQIRAT